MSIRPTSSINNQHIQNSDYNSAETHLRQTEPHANGYRVDGKDIAAAIQTTIVGIATPAGAAAAAGSLLSQATAGGTTPQATGGGADYTSNMDRIQADGFRNSTYLISLQQQIQDENRQFTTVTNVIRAKHDTAKAALANIRS